MCLLAQAQGPFVTLEQNGLWLSLFFLILLELIMLCDYVTQSLY